MSDQIRLIVLIDHVKLINVYSLVLIPSFFQLSNVYQLYGDVDLYLNSSGYVGEISIDDGVCVKGQVGNVGGTVS